MTTERILNNYNNLIDEIEIFLEEKGLLDEFAEFRANVTKCITTYERIYKED